MRSECGPEARVPICAPIAGQRPAYPHVLRLRLGGPRTHMCSDCGPEARVPTRAPIAARRPAYPHVHRKPVPYGADLRTAPLLEELLLRLATALLNPRIVANRQPRGFVNPDVILAALYGVVIAGNNGTAGDILRRHGSFA